MVKIFTPNLLRTFKSTLFKAVFLFGLVVMCSFNNVSGSRSLPLSVQAKLVKCYPNPATSFINFEMADAAAVKGYSLEVYSFTGKKMYESQVTSGKINLTLNDDYYRGLYVYQLKDKSQKIAETGKFQVVK